MNLLELAAAWRREGRQVALATVVATWGSSPCPPGSQLVADDTGRFMGSVSGGCIEGEVMRRALQVIETAVPQPPGLLTGFPPEQVRFITSKWAAA